MILEWLVIFLKILLNIIPSVDFFVFNLAILFVAFLMTSIFGDSQLKQLKKCQIVLQTLFLTAIADTISERELEQKCC